MDDLELAVPEEQRPANELTALKADWLLSWATLPLEAYLKRLSVVFGVFFLAVGAPISNQTFDPAANPAEFALSAAIGSSFVVAVLMIRIYLAWSYVGERLRSAAVAYEETGWYDGQTFIKPPPVLARDRLLANYEVKPVLSTVRSTLLGMAALLLAASVALAGLIQAGTDEDGVFGRGSSRRPAPRQVTADGLLFGRRVRDINQLATDDDLAAEEAAAQGSVPGYCSDRYFRALANGNDVCRKFER